MSHCAELGIDLSSLTSCGCDGTNTNTGRHSGVVALLERRLGRQLQRSICCLHRIELPFRHYFTSLDGVTTGPNSFSGPIGTLAAGQLHLLKPRKFTPLQCPDFSKLPDDVLRKLSWDQKVLYRHVVAVQSGKSILTFFVILDDFWRMKLFQLHSCLNAAKLTVHKINLINMLSGTLPPELASTEIGPVCHSRWITFQSRILRLFMSSGVLKSVLPKLRKLAIYVLNIYFPMHMNI